MPQRSASQLSGETPAERYERYFVPAIGAPMAGDMLRTASLRPGERVLDVACGTGVVTRLSAEVVGPKGAVTGLDVDPAMLAVARSAHSGVESIEWLEASAEAMPIPDTTYDVALCQMGLQFMANKVAALSEMRRALKNGGRAIVTTPGPTPQMFEILEDAVAQRLNKDVAPFVSLVFSLHKVGDIEELLSRAGFSDIDVRSDVKSLGLPAPRDFLWQYVNSTPLAGAVAQANEGEIAAFEQEVCAKWQAFAQDDGMALCLRVTTASARR